MLFTDSYPQLDSFGIKVDIQHNVKQNKNNSELLHYPIILQKHDQKHLKNILVVDYTLLHRWKHKKH